MVGAMGLVDAVASASYISAVTVCDLSATRASDGDRDAALASLHDAYVQGCISHQTLVQRIDAVLIARTDRQLALLLADLGEPTLQQRGRSLFALVRHLSRVIHGVRTAWRAPLLPPLTLPGGADGDRIIGRHEGCDLTIRDQSVSRTHAALHRGRDGWYIVDLDSTNGTFVNGWRIAGPTPVAAGDVLTLGAASFQLVSTQRIPAAM